MTGLLHRMRASNRVRVSPRSAGNRLSRNLSAAHRARACPSPYSQERKHRGPRNTSDRSSRSRPNSTNMTLLKPLMQWLHVGSVVLMIGGFFFFRVILMPVASRLPDPTAFITSALRRFSGIVWCALLTVLISGLYNFITFFRAARGVAAAEMPYFSLYILVIGIKLFIVFLIYTLAIMLTFPYPVFEIFQKKPAPWLNLTVIFGLIVIFLSAFLRRLG